MIKRDSHFESHCMFRYLPQTVLKLEQNVKLAKDILAKHKSREAELFTFKISSIQSFNLN